MIYLHVKNKKINKIPILGKYLSRIFGSCLSTVLGKHLNGRKKSSSIGMYLSTYKSHVLGMYLSTYKSHVLGMYLLYYKSCILCMC